jgi:hypothetical protein
MAAGDPAAAVLLGNGATATNDIRFRAADDAQ